MNVDALNEYHCEECGFALYVPLARIGACAVGLYDDARFPGRCIVALSRHADCFDLLSARELLEISTVAQIVGRSIREELEIKRVNYAVLGNVEPHIHYHVIPRGQAQDSVTDAAPWKHPSTLAPLDPRTQRSISERLKQRFMVVARTMWENRP